MKPGDLVKIELDGVDEHCLVLEVIRGDRMKPGDLVKGKGWEYHYYGYGIIMDVRYGSIAVMWPSKKIWSYVSHNCLELINECR